MFAMPTRPLLLIRPLAARICVPQSAAAATSLDGAAMSWPWALPFLGILLTIATGPLLFPKIWHRHYGKIAALWSALALIPIAVSAGADAALDALVHAMLGDYLSFIVLLFALYTVAGGILVTGDLRGTPFNNAVLLAIGTLMASFVGTTGAAMILIRPLLRAPHSHAQCARGRLLHFSRCQYRRRLEPARGSASVRWFPARH
jgi:hypothetical protein